ESIYMGGGTPTTLEPELLDELLQTVEECFDLSVCREFTVEAGRPDTITEKKLQILRDHGVDRISINPQSMQQRTLDLIGRKHTTEDVRKAFALAEGVGFRFVNADLIAGLPGEEYEDFADSFQQVLALGADNITLHTLAVKRASRLKERDANFHYRDEDLREKMLGFAQERLRREGFVPYYLYRQKHTSGNTENIGYCRRDLASIYNIRIMEEHQSILALGAGGISKVWFPAANRLERVPNVSNYDIYIERIDDMIDRKRKDFFGQEE
ncbi:MAG: coproporphyrinogen dehydrogenase HemZ, partial [Bacillota bacterium]|nr:coproporphyrinogen dehydrogenase HemZ [Bacillota bacterium]